MRTIFQLLAIGLIALGVPTAPSFGQQATPRFQPNTEQCTHWDLGLIREEIGAGRSGRTGLKVNGVKRGSPAASMGLEPGDVIVAINGHKISSWKAYINAIGKSGSVCKVTVDDVRGRGLMIDSCHFAEAPANSHMDLFKVVASTVSRNSSGGETVVAFVANEPETLFTGNRDPDNVSPSDLLAPICVWRYRRGGRRNVDRISSFDRVLGSDKTHWPKRTVCVGVISLSANKAIVDVFTHYNFGLAEDSRGGKGERWTLTKSRRGWSVGNRQLRVRWD